MSQVILGLCAYTHDSAAALLVDGHLVGFCEEERLDGVKRGQSVISKDNADTRTE